MDGIKGFFVVEHGIKECAREAELWKKGDNQWFSRKG
jgi:hypothetical protein